MIFDMMLVHYAKYMPRFIGKIIVYHDVAMEGFLLLSGFMIGKHYLQKFKENKRFVSKKLLGRAVKILVVQYIMIVFVSMPHYMIMSNSSELWTATEFLVKSLLFYNQIGLLHILPTFIPLFILSPLILLFLHRDWDILILIVSCGFFVLGQIVPYIFNYGDKTYFPVILWQTYFVMGCLLGKMSMLKGHDFPDKEIKLFVLACFVVCTVLLFQHSTTFSYNITLFKAEHNIVIAKFPLNIYGLCYGASLWFFIYSIAHVAWRWIKEVTYLDAILIFGRHSLLVFVLHVCFSKWLDVFVKISGSNNLFIYFWISANFVVTYLFLKRYEIQKQAGGSKVLDFMRWAFN
jgi:hypothetical protein